MKTWIKTIAAVAIIIPLALLAQSNENFTHHKPNPEIGKYIKEQVMPVLIKKRQQFDAELSADEKKEIADCKAALKQLGPPHHDFRKPDENTPGNADNKAYNPEPGNDQRFEQHHAIMQKLEAIAAKHSNSLDEIKKQLEPQRTQWMADIKKLREANAPANDDQKNAEPQDGHGFGHHPGPEMFIYDHHNAAHFLLLPTSIEELNKEQAEMEAAPVLNNAVPAITASVIKLNNIQVLPNPASNDLQLGNDAIPATNQFRIYDLNGKEVFKAENVQASQHFDISQLPAGTYLVQVKSADQVVSQKIVVSK